MLDGKHFASCQSWRLPSRYNLRAGLYGISWEHFTRGWRRYFRIGRYDHANDAVDHPSLHALMI